MSLFTRMAEGTGAVFSWQGARAWETEFPSLGRGTFSGKKVGRTSSLQMIAVYACQSLIADSIAMLPVDHMTKANGILDTVDPARTPRWVKQPNPFQTSFEFWHRVIISLLSDGNAFIATLRNDRGEVNGLYCLHPQSVQIKDGPLGENTYSVSDPRGAIQGWFDRTQVLHIPAFTIPGYSRGLSPIDIAREAIGLGLTAEEFGARFFEQGTTMAGVIEHPGAPRPDEAKLLRDMFKKTHAGTKNSHSVGVLTGGASFKPISLSPEQAQFLETRRFQKGEIALLYRVPAYLVDSQVTSTWGHGIEEQNKFFVDQTLMPWIVRIEQSVSTFLLPGSQFIKFNLDARLRAKTKDRYEAYRWAVSYGFMCPDEVRALEDMDPLPDGLGQRFYMPANITEIGADDETSEEQMAEDPAENPGGNDAPNTGDPDPMTGVPGNEPTGEGVTEPGDI